MHWRLQSVLAHKYNQRSSYKKKSHLSLQLKSMGNVEIFQWKVWDFRNTNNFDRLLVWSNFQQSFHRKRNFGNTQILGQKGKRNRIFGWSLIILFIYLFWFYFLILKTIFLWLWKWFFLLIQKRCINISTINTSII